MNDTTRGRLPLLILESDALKRDALAMALRLYSEPDETMSPECIEVMSRWRPTVDAILSNHDPEANS